MLILIKFIYSFPAVCLTVYKDLIYQVKKKSTEYFGRWRSAKAPILQEKVGVKKHLLTNLFPGRPVTVHSTES